MNLRFGSYRSGPNRVGFRKYPAGQGTCFCLCLPPAPWSKVPWSRLVLFVEVVG